MGEEKIFMKVKNIIFSRSAGWAKIFLRLLIVVSLIAFIYNAIISPQIVYLLLNAIILVLILTLYRGVNEVDFSQKKIISQKEEIDKLENEIEELEENLENKMTKARRVHKRLLPDKLPQPRDVFISAYYQPAEYTGGDYYNIFKIDHGAMDDLLNQYLIYFFDVSGHGIDSTLLSIFINDTIENYFKMRHNPGEKVSPQELMNYIDRQYQNEGFPDDYLVCLFLGLLDFNNYTLSYSAGGLHFPGFKINPYQEIEEISMGGFPVSTGLGMMKDVRPERKISFEENDTLLLSTDGLYEEGRDSEMYYDVRLNEVLNNFKHLPSPFFKQALKKDFFDFIGDNRAGDDVTFMVLSRPEGDIKQWDLDGEDDIQQKISDITDHIDRNFPQIWEDLTLNFEEYLPAEKENLEIKVRAVKNESFVILEMEDKTGRIEKWEDIINKDANKDRFTDFEMAENIATMRKKVIYAAYDSSYHRLYFMQNTK